MGICHKRLDLHALDTILGHGLTGDAKAVGLSSAPIDFASPCVKVQMMSWAPLLRFGSLAAVGVAGTPQ